MFDGTQKYVQDLKTNDEIMGDDSKPRKIISLSQGFGLMFQISAKNEPFHSIKINNEHILCLKKSKQINFGNLNVSYYFQNKKKNQKEMAKNLIRKFISKNNFQFNNEENEEKIIEISVKDFIQKDLKWKKKHLMYRVPVDFKHQNIPIFPYLLGFLLSSLEYFNFTRKKKIANQEEFYNYVSDSLSSITKNTNILNQFDQNYQFIFQKLKKFHLLENVHIPLCYKANDKKTRLQVFLGFLDHWEFFRVEKTTIFLMKIYNNQFANDLLFIIKSLGLSAHIERNSVLINLQNLEELTYDFEIKCIGEDSYYGFQIDGNGRFVLPDLTVSHNSNIFHAIRMVFAGIFTSLPLKERSALIYEGTKDSSKSNIEIILDNSKNTFPILDHKVHIKRILTKTNDEFFLNEKKIKKNELANFLQSAGFITRNQFYFLEQGQVTKLALMKNFERYKLIKEVIGTNLYEKKRKDCMKELNKNKIEMKKIEELIRVLEERINELDEETKELQEYQNVLKEKRALEHILLTRKLELIKIKIEQIEKQIDLSNKESNSANRDYDTAKTVFKQKKNEEEKLKKKLNQANIEMENLRQEKNQLIKIRLQKDLEMKELIKKNQFMEEEKQKYGNEIEEIEEEIQQNQLKLAKISQKFEQKFKKENEIESQIQLLEIEKSSILSSKTKFTSFRNDDEKKEWIEKEIEKFIHLKGKEENLKKNTSTEIERIEREMEVMREEINKNQSNISERRERIDKSSKEIVELEKKRDEILHRKKILSKSKLKAEEELENVLKEQFKYQLKLEKKLKWEVSKALKKVKKYAKNEVNSGIFGQVIELFDCEDKYIPSIEIFSGDEIFAVVVDSKETIEKIRKKCFSKNKYGSIIFIPLNSISEKKAESTKKEYLQMFSESNPNVIPMISVLDYSPTFRKVFDKIFGNGFICSKFEVGVELSKNNSIRCATLDGDIINGAGCIQGGYFDPQKSSIKMMKKIKFLRNKAKESALNLNKILKAIRDDDEELSLILIELEKLKMKFKQNTETFDQILREQSELEESINLHQEMLNNKNRLFSTFDPNINNLEEKINQLKKEILIENSDEFLKEEIERLEKLEEEINSLKKELLDYSTKRGKLEIEKVELENFIKENLSKQKTVLSLRMKDSRNQKIEYELNSNKEELLRINGRIETISLEMKSLNEIIKSVEEEIFNFESVLDEESSQKQTISDQMNQKSKELDELLNRKRNLKLREEKLYGSIQEIGSFPLDILQKYQDEETSRIQILREEKNEELKNFEQVNNKAKDQFSRGFKEKEQLLEKKRLIEENLLKIYGYIEDLDQTKEKIFNEKFNEIQKNFAQVFKEIIPKGIAELIIDYEKNQNENEKKNIFGISIYATFQEESQEEKKNIIEFSGGQKSIISLSLLFAFQRTEPAPFYLLDEIDSALDPQFRLAVGELIYKESRKSQFITTTFRPEFLQFADCYFWVNFQNKESKVKKIGKNEAIEIIRSKEENEERREQSNFDKNSI
ncbi:structural maintenance of chromosomes protein [Anaeramoeba ignava]|uniref:Structural maintenance of chromosomes protein n=1 Tax=Anaeramoeba ignava TaxID=1746090 RepID=A0A9Q0RA57_ANAIG|nr:structural maintenance of chromosomes protein [Anaeramoeba ignava]